MAPSTRDPNGNPRRDEDDYGVPAYAALDPRDYRGWERDDDRDPRRPHGVQQLRDFFASGHGFNQSSRGDYAHERHSQGDYRTQGYRTGMGYGINSLAGPRSPEGAHRMQRMLGRGPKGYQRSDERILEDLSERLAYDDYIDSSDVTINVRDGVVTLEGTVPERHMKHAIEDLAESCRGVRDIENRIRVPRS